MFYMVDANIDKAYGQTYLKIYENSQCHAKRKFWLPFCKKLNLVTWRTSFYAVLPRRSNQDLPTSERRFRVQVSARPGQEVISLAPETQRALQASLGQT